MSASPLLAKSLLEVPANWSGQRDRLQRVRMRSLRIAWTVSAIGISPGVNTHRRTC